MMHPTPTQTALARGLEQERVGNHNQQKSQLVLVTQHQMKPLKANSLLDWSSGEQDVTSVVHHKHHLPSH